MITIIIASANAELLKNVTENISKTIGVSYEILSFANENGQYGICEIYNKGIKAAKYDVLCFMHEDIDIKTENWGQLVLDCFDGNFDLGLIGIAGSSYKAAFPSTWYSWVDKANRYNIIQRFKHSVVETRLDYHNPLNEKLALVTAVDGVWFCVPRSVTVDIKFDEQLLKGFHGYDLDISLSIGKKWDVAVTFDILIEHFSEGNYDRAWIEHMLLIHKKWSSALPIKNENSLNKKEAAICEMNAVKYFIDKMMFAGYKKRKMYEVLWQSKLYLILGWSDFLKSGYYIFSLKKKQG